MRVFRGISTFCAFIGLGFFSSGCVKIPDLDGAAKVPVSSVVARIKCDLAIAMMDKLNEPTNVFDFLEQWSAKVHLTIVVDDTIALTPGASLNVPLSNAFPNVGPTSLGGTSIAAVSQNYSFGFGAGYTTEAVRQEDIEFFLTLSKLYDPSTGHYVPQGCYSVVDGVLLESDLKLGQVFDVALAPVRDRILVPGTTNGPATVVPPVPTDQVNKLISQKIDTVPKAEQHKFDLFLENKRTGEDPIGPQKAEAAQREAKAQALVNNVIKPLVDEAAAYSCQNTTNASRYQAIADSAQVTIQKLVVDGATSADQANNALEAERKAGLDLDTQTQAFMTALSKCLSAYKQPKKPPNTYDPIDLISQQINFYITATGSVTPSWKLVRTSGPTTPTFAATRKDTNTLTIALGRPTAAPDGSLVASPPMNNAILSATIGQAFVLH